MKDKTLMTLMATGIACLITAALWGCATVPPPVPGTPTCNTACERLRVLECEEGQPNQHGVTCEMVCQSGQATGIIEIDVECLTVAMNCEEARVCQ